MWPTGPEWTSRPDDDSPGGSLTTVAGLTCGLRGGTIDGRPPTGSTPTPPQGGRPRPLRGGSQRPQSTCTGPLERARNRGDCRCTTTVAVPGGVTVGGYRGVVVGDRGLLDHRELELSDGAARDQRYRAAVTARGSPEQEQPHPDDRCWCEQQGRRDSRLGGRCEELAGLACDLWGGGYREVTL